MTLNSHISLKLIGIIKYILRIVLFEKSKKKKKIKSLIVISMSKLQILK